MLTLPPGAYTAQTAGANNTAGVALVEIYDADATAALFDEDCYWRDLVSFTWNVCTQEGRGAIAAMVKESLGYKYHWAVADYLQRAARHIASKVDVEQAYAMGQAAVSLALKGRNAVMPVVVRKSDKPYRWAVGEVPLSKVANVEKKVPRNFITKDGFGITEACRRYLQPLIAGEDYPPYKNGLPQYVRLKNKAVKKRLTTTFKP